MKCLKSFLSRLLGRLCSRRSWSFDHCSNALGFPRSTIQTLLLEMGPALDGGTTQLAFHSISLPGGTSGDLSPLVSGRSYSRSFWVPDFLRRFGSLLLSLTWSRKSSALSTLISMELSFGILKPKRFVKTSQGNGASSSSEGEKAKEEIQFLLGLSEPRLSEPNRNSAKKEQAQVKRRRVRSEKKARN